MTVNWFKEDNKLSQNGGDNYEIYESVISSGVNSVLVIRSVSRSDGLTYKCTGSNDYGNDERRIKLMVVEVPSRPINLRLKEVWSRSASVSWSSPFAGNSPISGYVVQYWRKNTNNDQQQQQNHRRQEISVSGSQNSVIISNLMPALTYEASVIAENQIGKSEPSDNIVINTSEDEPAASPSDVVVEARGPSTIRVSWKAPPVETWNGKLLGFYVGFRVRSVPNTIESQLASVVGNQAGAYSYRTVEFVKGQQLFETFLTNLNRGYEYEVIVKAFNSIGSGPESHSMLVRTFDGDLPAAPSLFAHQTSQSAISLRWTYPTRAQSPFATIKRYILYYQRQGDDSWLEIGIPIEERFRTSATSSGQGQSQINVAAEGASNGLFISETGTTSYLLSGLDSGFAYKIYVVAVNNFGMGDPSNIVVTKTDSVPGMLDSGSRLSGGLIAGSSDFNVFDMNRQAQLFMVVPVICTAVVVFAIIISVIYCTRRMPQQSSATTNIQSRLQMVPNQQQQTMQSTNTWGTDGSGAAGSVQVGQRYVEFDKNGILKNGSSLMGSEQGGPSNNQFQLPYGTMPMNSVVLADQKSWDRQSSAPLKPLVPHIYDSPI